MNFPIRNLCRPGAISTFALMAVLGLSGCNTTPKADEQQTSGAAMTELSKALREHANQAVQARLALSRMDTTSAKAAPVALQAGQGDTAARPASARIDIDYVGPVENATRIISNTLGWQFSQVGKKRAEVLVSLRHSGVDSLTVLRDIGAQCGSRCDIHVELVEGGQSSVELAFRD